MDLISETRCIFVAQDYLCKSRCASVHAHVSSFFQISRFGPALWLQRMRLCRASNRKLMGVVVSRRAGELQMLSLITVPVPGPTRDPTVHHSFPSHELEPRVQHGFLVSS